MKETNQSSAKAATKGTTGEWGLATEEALLAGADLWVMADLASSAWTQKIDWYLNFQILRSSTHRTMQSSPELKQVLAHWEVELPVEPNRKTDTAETAPLMIASSERLPNHAVVMIPLATSAESAESTDSAPSDPSASKRWVARVHDTWRGLDEPKLRVFLPKGMTAEQFARSWSGRKDAIEHALVPELPF
ncbi:MAG: hypothetical protein NDI61_10825 [Bdellovibrionaceae bacterium]|nr:hypothetical protein [Pseudobdellovibrionaceae bacterium]